MEWSIPKRAATPVSFITDSRGHHQIQVQSFETINRSGTFRIEIKAARAAAATDPQQVTACKKLAHAVELRRQWTEMALRKAINEYKKARAVWKEVGDAPQEALALMNMGHVWEILSDWQTALVCYKEAHAIYSRIHDTTGSIQAIHARSALFLNQGEFQKALEIYGPERTDTVDPWERARILRNLGAAYYGMNEKEKAAAHLRDSLNLREQLQDKAGQADTLLYLGYVHHAVKELPVAEEYYRRSLELWQAAKNPRGTALALTALGHLSNISGERQRALELYDQAQHTFQEIGDLSGSYTVLEGKAYLYAGLGEKQKALQHYRSALALVRRAKDLVAEGNILDYISALYRDLGDFRNALQYSQQSVQINHALPSILGESYALSNLGKAQEALGKQVDAMASYTRALELAQRGEDRFLEGLLINALGQLHHKSGQLQMALDYFKQALSMQQESRDSVRMPGTLFDLARAEREAGNLDTAIQYARQGLDLTESLRGKVASLELRGSYLAAVHQQHELMIRLLMLQHFRHPAEGYDAAALLASERARARTLLDSLIESKAKIRQGVDPALLERERLLQASLNKKAEQQMQLLGRKYTKEEAAALAEEISGIAEEYEGVQSRIRSQSPHYAALTQPQPLSLAEMQQRVVDEDTLLLEYALGEECSYLWAVTPTSLRSYELPGRTEIESRARRVRELMLARQGRSEESAAQYQQRLRRADQEYRQESEALSQLLLGPVADRLQSQRLLVVTEGALQYLPFAALPKPRAPAQAANANPSMGSPLIADHEIVSLPSASVLGVLRQEIGQRPVPPKTVAVLADPVFEADDPRIHRKKASTSPKSRPNLDKRASRTITSQRGMDEIGFDTISRLPASREEADSILALIPDGAGSKIFGFNANRAMAMGPELGQYRFVHFATHGFLNDEHPELSGLVLSLFDEEGHPQDGYLRLHDIYNLNLPIEMVVLSSCNSGLGKEIRGEGLVGIVRGFMYAGAARVVASLWKVEDEATAALMKRFYQRMLQEGLPPAKALRMAQLDLRQQRRWQSPYYWAAFILQGEWK